MYSEVCKRKQRIEHKSVAQKQLYCQQQFLVVVVEEERVSTAKEKKKLQQGPHRRTRKPCCE